MNSSAAKQIDVLHKSLYERAFADANASSLMVHPTIFKYAKNFERSLPHRYTRSTFPSLIKDIKKARVLLYGDFHTHRQSQRGLVRLLRTIRQKIPYKRIILGLECFKYDDTKLIDKFMAGSISEQQLLRKTSYSNDWGFPWRNYKMILDTAGELNIDIMGINTPQAGRDSLKSRDQLAAELIASQTLDDKNSLFIAMVGEYHLAEQHLLQELKKIDPKYETSTVRVLNNIDKYFFKNKNTKLSPKSSELLKLKPLMYCIMNSPPWIKWRSFAIWEEMRLLNSDFQTGEDDDQIYNEEHFDIDQQFMQLVESIASFLNLKIDSAIRSSFSIEYNLDEHKFISRTTKRENLNREMENSIERISIDGFYQFNQERRIVFSDLTLNHLAEASGQFLQCSLSEFNDKDLHPGEAFFRRVLKFAAGMIAGKILNPRRKGPTINELRALDSLDTKFNTSTQSRIRRDTAHQIIKFHDWSKSTRQNTSSGNEVPLLLYRMDERKSYEISHMLGLLLGEKLYTQNIKGKISQKQLSKIFSNPLQDTVSSYQAFINFYSKI